MITGLDVVPDNEMNLHDINLQGGQQCSVCGAQPYMNHANGWTTIHNPIEEPEDVHIYGDGPTSSEGTPPAQHQDREHLHPGEDHTG